MASKRPPKLTPEQRVEYSKKNGIIVNPASGTTFRLSLPAYAADVLGWKPGTKLIWRIEDGELIYSLHPDYPQPGKGWRRGKG